MPDQTEPTPDLTDATTGATTRTATADDLDAPAARDNEFARRTILRVGAVGATGAAAIAAKDLWVPNLAHRGMLSADGAFAATSTALGDTVFFTEVFPTSPLILSPFKDLLNVPTALKPEDTSIFSAWDDPPG